MSFLDACVDHAGQKIKEVLGFPARQVDHEGPRFAGDDPAPVPAAGCRRAPPRRPVFRLAAHSARPSDASPRCLVQPRKKTASGGRRAAFAPARPGSPVPFAIAQAAPIPPPPCPRTPTQPPAGSRHDPKASSGKSPNKAINASPSPRNPRNMRRFRNWCTSSSFPKFDSFKRPCRVYRTKHGRRGIG